MLALPRPTRAAHILRLHVRALSTVADSASSPNTDLEQSSNDPAPDKPVKTRQTRRANSSAECMFVHPWNGIRSSAEGLAIARALQDKYGVAKEVLFPRDPDSVNLFQPYFWLVFDDPNVRKRFPLPEADAQITVHVADLPQGDGNIGVEEMMLGLGFSTTDGKDPQYEPTPTPPTETETETETEPSKSASDVPHEGYKTLDVRVEWSRFGPSEVLRRRRPTAASLPNGDILPGFAAAWLAFDGFSPESARGPHTPNLFRAREKWRKIAPHASSALRGSDDHTVTTAAASSTSSQETAEVEDAAEPTAGAQEQKIPSREWVPIIPSSTPFAPRPRPASVPPKDNNASATTAAPDGPSLVTPPTADAVADTTDATPRPTTPDVTKTEGTTASLGAKLNRRERILHLARQNARTPLPKLDENTQTPPAPPPTEAEKFDEEHERQGKERTIRERLWRLVGGNY